MWRADHGGFKVEYGALILLVATIVVAVFAFGLPTRTQEFYIAALCRIDPERQDCEQFGGGPGSGGEGSADGSDDGSADDGSADDEGSGDEEGSDGEEESGGDEEGSADEEDGWDPALAEALYDAEQELDDAEQELADVDDPWDELLDVVADIIGYNDAKACLTEGDLVACLWTVVGFSPWGKGAKLVKNIPKITKLWNRWRKAKKLKNTRKAKVAEAQRKYDDAYSACEELADAAVDGATSGRLHPVTATVVGGTLVLEPAAEQPADGTPATGLVPIDPSPAPLPRSGSAPVAEAGFFVPAGKKDKKPSACSFHPAPSSLSAFPNAKKAKAKTSVQGGGKKRARWKDDKGNIYEWDYQHGTVEKYNKRGKHQGEYDATTGEQTKPPDSTRSVEP
ncbi:colicin E3/pyocin S6 family cytotoxin [Nocardiopsis sp. RSe5-2]|uniref:Colicin E3/pyocin S6 family cytotoxin n=1 Tax=Nocardiopsis endophytica TaxID=3018445 RepID=A0ABT4U274_9ACTN|nr:colicin E3/pyocin S6 family cytotoxin [Nocardiopsis endophytica]MDA2811048.1 colicin E3/pyocin S6 family cytotoxin [Nocardiopsis endophytica]